MAEDRSSQDEDEGRGSPSGPTERLFLGVALPDGVRADVAALDEPARGVSWTRPEQIHLTLRFLGEVGPEATDGIEERLAGVRVEAFILPVEGVGLFPPGAPPRILWVGVGAGHPHLFQLRQRLDDAILAAGVDLDVRRFQPHITVGRCSAGGAPAARSWLRRHRAFSSAPFRVKAFELCSSRLLPEGAVHTVRRRFPLT
ncbi:MAG TPA: RNA 2',3'-cyclic phosphodiesterase [Opitutaceae bacterium]|jgi:2'-5' RNA ligase